MFIVLAIVVILAAIAAFVASRPAKFRIERSALVHAPGSTVFALVNDFHEWYKWSPWEKLDPNMKKTFSGASAGPGAEYAWVGNGKAGEGNMTLLSSTAHEVVAIQLRFLKPFPATNISTFKLSPAPDGTMVYWIVEGENGFAGKAFGLLVDMDKLLGKDFEEGLANLNTVARASAN
jgi:Polyketide cyclase / dehydrase and lipid transport